jgi:hypothetical protein
MKEKGRGFRRALIALTGIVGLRSPFRRRQSKSAVADFDQP